MNRRSFLKRTAAGLLIPAAPAILFAANIMPIRPVVACGEFYALDPFGSGGIVLIDRIRDLLMYGQTFTINGDRVDPANVIVSRGIGV